MRPIANFTFHAILAAAIAAFATTSAAAAGRPIIDNEGYVYLPGKLLGQPAAGQGTRLKVKAFGWGTSEDSANLGSWTKVDGLDVSWDVAEHQMPGNTKYSNVKLTRAAPAERQGANETITVGSNRTESGLPTGKRQHKPVLSRAEGPVLSRAEGPVLSRAEGPVLSRAEGPFTLAKPAGKGSVWIRVASPWAGCRVGERYPALELGSGAQVYVLHDAVVAGCARSGDVLAVDYARVTVRGWDPKKKQPITGQAR